MKKVFQILFYILLAAAIAWGAWKLAGVLGITPKTTEQYNDELWLTMSNIDPEGFTIFGVPISKDALRLPGSNDPIAFMGELNDPRKQAIQSRGKLALELLEELQDFDKNEFPGYGDIERKLTSLSAPPPYPMADVLALQSGELYRTPFLVCYAHSIRNPSQAEAYVERLRALGSKADAWSKRIDQEIANQGNVPPQVIQAATAFCQRFVAIPPLKHPLYISFARRMARKGEVRVPQDEGIKMLDRVYSLLEDRVLPEWEKLAQKLSALEATTSFEKGLEKGLKKELGQDFSENLGSLEQNILSFADSLKKQLDSIPNISKADWLRNQTSVDKQWLDSLQLFVDRLQARSAGLYQDLPAFRSLEIIAQDSLQQVLDLPYWYLPADEAGHRKAKLFVHPNTLGHAATTARGWLIQATIPGEHTRFKKRSGRALPTDAKASGFGLYGSGLADEIGLNTFRENGIPPFPEGKAVSLQLQLLACELALLDLGKEIKLANVPEQIKAPFLMRTHSRPGYALASWIEYKSILNRRSEAKKQDGNLFYLAKFNEELMK